MVTDVSVHGALLSSLILPISMNKSLIKPPLKMSYFYWPFWVNDCTLTHDPRRVHSAVKGSGLPTAGLKALHQCLAERRVQHVENVAQGRVKDLQTIQGLV